MKIYRCDRCGTDETTEDVWIWKFTSCEDAGIIQTLDLCNPCLNKVLQEEEQ